MTLGCFVRLIHSYGEQYVQACLLFKPFGLELCGYCVEQTHISEQIDVLEISNQAGRNRSAWNSRGVRIAK